MQMEFYLTRWFGKCKISSTFNDKAKKNSLNFKSELDYFSDKGNIVITNM